LKRLANAAAHKRFQREITALSAEHLFRQLILLHKSGEEAVLFAECLRQSPQMIPELRKFLARTTPSSEIAILILLLGKTMDPSAINDLMGFLSSTHAELRRAAIQALGWNRASKALKELDEIYANDFSPVVREEASIAIEEILTAHPNERNRLRFHPARGRINGTDSIASILPRLLSVRYGAVPLRMDETGKVHVAVASGTERRILTTLEAVIGRAIELESWPIDRIATGRESLYVEGDDDFCAFLHELSEVAQEELVDVIVAGVRPHEPCSPLPESGDGVEAAQSLLAYSIAQEARAIIIRSGQPMGLFVVPAGHEQPLDPPEPRVQERFLGVLRLLAAHESIVEAQTGAQAGELRFTLRGR